METLASFDSRRPGLGEGRKGERELMRVGKSEGGRRGKGGLSERQGNYNRDTDRHRDHTLSSLWRISVCDRKISKATRHRIWVERQAPGSQPALHLSGPGAWIIGTLGTQREEKRLVG